MLKRITIENLVLVDCETVVFQPGFNALSGETGAGKSALMGALGLALGDKCDASLIRRGAARAVVEAVFAKPANPLWQQLVEQEGLEADFCDEVVLRREVSTNGRSRAFINEQLVTQSTLKELSPLLVTRLGQESTYKLRNAEVQRGLFDCFAESEKALQAFRECYEREKVAEEEIKILLLDAARREREQLACEEDLAEIRSASLKDDEEKEIFEEYSILTNAEAIAEKAGYLCQEIDESESAILCRMRSLNHTIDSLVQLDPSFGPISAQFREAVIAIQDVSYCLRNRLDSIDFSFERMEELNQRLTTINRLKRKYGRSIDEIQEKERQLDGRLKSCLDADTKLNKLKSELQEIKIAAEKCAKKLSQIRQQACKEFQKSVRDELRHLNMSKADFEVRLTGCKRSFSGDEKIEFFLAPNPGEPMVSVAESVSGGELARLLLSIKVVLAAKEPPAALLFDEIDAHIGGETASAVGKKLRELGKKHQILCITHFAQVAVHAHAHLKIEKKENQGRTLTCVTPLNGGQRQEEIVRMIGGETSLACR